MIVYKCTGDDDLTVGINASSYETSDSDSEGENNFMHVLAL